MQALISHRLSILENIEKRWGSLLRGDGYVEDEMDSLQFSFTYSKE
jgi:hypothetical protein